MSETHTEPLGNPQPPQATHGYWGPLPGESIELYKALGVPRMERIILAHVPQYWRGEFNMQAGRDLEVRVHTDKIIPPNLLDRQKRLEKFVQFTQRNELNHVGTFVVLGAVGISQSIEGGWLGVGSAVAIGVTNIIYNIPTILVQRYNRLRAYRLLDKLGVRQDSSGADNE